MKSPEETEFSGRAALDAAIKASSNFKSYREVINKFSEDRKAAGDNWHRFLVEKCGIILNNKDTGAVSGSDAGSATAKGADDIIPSTGKAKYPKGTSFTVDGLTIYGVPPKEELTKDQQYIVQGLYSRWLRDALALIKESYGLTFTEEGTTSARMKLQFYDEDDGTLAYVSPDSKDGKSFEARTLTINMHYFKNMSSTNRHGKAVINEEYGIEWQLDRTLVHELTHGVMAANVDYFHDLPLTIIEGATAELIHGIDDKRYDSIIDCVKDKSKFEELSKCLSPQAKGNEDMGSNFAYAGGYIFMRYFLKRAADTTFDYDTYHAKVSTDSLNFATNYFDKVTMSGSDTADTITNSGSKVSINTKSGADVIINYSAKVTITSGAGADRIQNEGAKAIINEGTGNDRVYNEGCVVYLSGGKGNDTIRNYGDHITISGGAGDDYLRNSGGKHITYNFGKNYGNDTVVGFNANDTIKITSGKYSATTSGKNVIVSVGSNSLTLKNAVGKAINFISSAGKTSTKTFSASSNANVAELWFAAEDNFATDNNLTSIVKNSQSALAYDKLEPTRLESLASKDKLITYSGK